MFRKSIRDFCSTDPVQAATELRWLIEKLLCRRHAKSHFRPNSNPEYVSRLMESLRTTVGTTPYAVWRFAARSLFPNEMYRLQSYIKARIFHDKPLQYIFGSVEFQDTHIKLRPPILIPRWETEEWVDKLANRLDSKATHDILDLCSGTGCISIALAYRLKLSRVLGLDISAKAIKLARLNARINKLMSQMNFQTVDIFSDSLLHSVRKAHMGGDAKFDLIVSNPPYIPPNQYAELDASVKHWEDKIALLTSDADGLEFYERISQISSTVLKPNGSIVCEIGSDQQEKVCEMFRRHFVNVECWNDLAGKNRVVIASHLIDRAEDDLSNKQRSYKGYWSVILQDVRNHSTKSASNIQQLPDNDLKLDAKTVSNDERKAISNDIINLSPPPPPGSEECCMSGCAFCVWDQYKVEYDEYLARRKQLILQAAPKVLDEVDIPEVAPMDTSMKAFLDFENSLKQR